MFANKFYSRSNKNVTKEAKNIRNENCSLARARATYCGLVWVLVVLHDLIWHFMVFYGLFVVLYGLFMVLWQNIDLSGLESSFLAVIDPNSFGLVLKNCRFLSILSSY